MKPSVYIESSVISYLAARPSRDVVVAGRQAITHDWWANHRQRFELRISALVEEEIGRGDEEAAARRRTFLSGIPSLAISDMAIELSELLLSEGAVPEGSAAYRNRCGSRRRLPSHVELPAHQQCGDQGCDCKVDRIA